MDKNYSKMFAKLDKIINELYEVGELAESTSCFPVISYVNLQSVFRDFYEDLRGASKKATEFNYLLAKQKLGSVYGMQVTAYMGTDSVFDFGECHRKIISERVAGAKCKACPFKDNCYNGTRWMKEN